MVIGVMMVGAAEARGQSGAATSVTTSARQTIEEAAKDEAAGRKREAIEGYKRAYALSGDATLLFRLGELSRQVGETSAADRFYRAYLARDRKGTHREAAERAVRALEVEELAPATANKPTSPPPAQPAAEGARPRAAPPSRPPTAAVAPAAAGVQGASSLIVHPPAPEGLTSGTTAGAIATAPAPSPPSPPLPRWVPWAGLAVTVALGAGAVYSGLGVSRRYDELSSSCGGTSAGCPQGDIDQLKSRALTANLLWAAAGLSALATGVMVYVNTRESGVSGVWRF